jgi:hypothetical protein
MSVLHGEPDQLGERDSGRGRHVGLGIGPRGGHGNAAQWRRTPQPWRRDVVETSGGSRRRRNVLVADRGVGGWSDLQGEAPKEWMMGVSDGWIQAKEEVQNKRRTNERRKENRKGKYEENKKILWAFRSLIILYKEVVFAKCFFKMFSISSENLLHQHSRI